MEDNRPFWESATKLVFVLLTFSIVIGMFVGKVESKDVMNLAFQAYAFYFGQKFAQNMAQNSQNQSNINNVNSQNGQ